MNLIKLKAKTPGTRHRVILKKNLLSKYNTLLKVLKKTLKRDSGRSKSTGHITVRHKQSGVKASYYNVNFKNLNFGLKLIISINYDPNRGTFVGNVFDLVTKKFDICLMPEGVYPGTIIYYNNNFKRINLGYRLPIKNLPIGSIIHNLSVKKDKMTQFIKSAGTFGQIIQKTNFIAKIRLPSNNILNVDVENAASLGILSNSLLQNTVIGKAGINRLKGHRPSVRGIAMNPVDHPHGGRTNGGRPSVTPWGKPTKGKPTVFKKNK